MHSYAGGMALPDAVLLDIDGVLVVSWEALPGAVEALERVRATDVPVRFLTNTTSSTRAEIAGLLRSAGFELDDDEVLTATGAAAAHLRAHHPGARCWLLNHGDITADLPEVDLVDDTVAPERVDVVLVGGAGSEFSWDAANRALACVLAGAALVAAHHNDVWRTSDGLVFDAGPYLSAIERVTGVEAVVVGKPAATMFDAGLTSAGARRCGLRHGRR